MLFNEHIAGHIQDTTRYGSRAKRVFVTMYESERGPLINKVLKAMESVYLKPLVSEGNREQSFGVEIITFDPMDEGGLKKHHAALPQNFCTTIQRANLKINPRL